jgi:hypothetical protein
LHVTKTGLPDRPTQPRFERVLLRMWVGEPGYEVQRK